MTGVKYRENKMGGAPALSLLSSSAVAKIRGDESSMTGFES